MKKQALRNVFKELRSNLRDREILSNSICSKAMEYIKINKIEEISCYFPISSEVDTREIIRYCLESRIRIYIPHIGSTSDMKMIKLSSLSELTISKFGVYQFNENMQNLEDKEANLEKLQVIFTPLLAFNRQKHRLGYGKGHYDKFFTKCPSSIKKIGLAFSLQEASDIPTENHDIGLDIIITEQEIF